MRNKLTAVTIKKAGDGRLSDGGGLILIKKGDTGRWIYRYQLAGRRRDMGLGGYPTVTLAAARSARDDWAAMVARGVDPVDERQRQEAEEAAARNETDPTFAELTALVFEARKATLKGDGKAGRWMSPLDNHVLPKIGAKRASALTAVQVKEAIKPIWRTKHVTAARALQRIRLILEGGKRMGLRSDPDIVDAARYLLGEHLYTPTPIPATPWRDVPALYARLGDGGSVAECLRFMILTAVRMAGCRWARLTEVEGDVWTIPGERMKGPRGKTPDFAVPLSGPALSIAEDARQWSDDLMFPGMRPGRPITETALEKRLREMGEEGRPHGFRSSFRMWVQDTDPTKFEVAETALAHRVGTKVERSYARSDMIEQRRVMMNKWAAFVTGEAADVVNISDRLRRS